MAEVARSRIGVATYLTPSGSLTDRSSVEEIGSMLEACLEASEIQLVIDFADVSLINSALLEVLLDAQDRLTRVGGSLKIAHANAAISDVMLLTGLDAYITLIDGASATEQPHGRGPRALGREKLGDLLVSRGLVSADKVIRAVDLQRSSGKQLGQILVDEEIISEPELLGVLAEQFSMPYVRVRTGVFDPQVVRLIDAETLTRLKVVPLFRVRGVIFLATSHPQLLPSFDAVKELTGCKVKAVLAGSREITETIKEAHCEDHNLSEYIGELDSEAEVEVIEHETPDSYTAIDEMASGSPVINLINGLIQRAVRDGASDIHIEPSRTRCRIRFRVDGVLYEVMKPPIDVHPALVSRLKVMSNLDISERRLPQDGRVQVYTHGRTIDLRFSSLPGIFGEKVVLRVLDKAQSIMEIEKLGMSTENLASFESLLHKSYGLLLVTGPTGSGKTTTLYAAINHLNSIEKSIVTIEDPVEYQVDIVNQNQVRERIGLGFAKLLKHVLRQDPDIVMVGEIRERETAEIAVQAALTGHLVLSTLHTNDSAGAVSRLLDMGIEPFLLSSALIGVVAQRLVRTVCTSCATSFVAPPGSLAKFNVDESETVRLVRGRGCELCYDSGYKGRAPIHELLVCDSSTQQLMVSNPSREALAEHIRNRGIKTLLDAGVSQVLAAKTTMEEVTRVVNV